MTSTEASEGIMRKIQALLERAAHPATPQAERESSQDMADRLMAKYRLDRAMLNFDKKKDERRQPSHREYDEIKLVTEDITVTMRDVKEEYGIQWVIDDLRTAIYSHAGCRSARKFGKLTVVGFEEDLFFGDMLWTTIFQDIVTKMFPRWNSSLGFDENVFNLKNAGFGWPQVREAGLAVGAADRNGVLTAENAGSKLRTAYNRHCKKIGYEKPATQPRQPGLWRRSFVDSYATRIRQRMIALRAEANQEAGEQGAVALIQEEDLVTQAFYDLFPNMNPANWPKPDPNAPQPKIKMGRQKKFKTREADPSAWDAGYRAANSVNLMNTKAAGDKKEALGG